MAAEYECVYFIDFDGTITTGDLSLELATYYGGSAYREIEKRYLRREIPIREWLSQAVRLLPPDLDLLSSKSLKWAAIRPGFKEFLDFARQENSLVIVASDGFGFYIEPILKEYGVLEKIDYVYRNEIMTGRNNELKVLTPHAHAICPVCGNCKAAHVVAVKETGKPVIYVGDGSNDRFGASWSDRICARGKLAEVCKEFNLTYSLWSDFYDIINIAKPDFKDCAETALCLPRGKGIKEGFDNS